MSYRSFQFSRFGLDALELVDNEKAAPGPGEVAVDVAAFSLNYRDLSVIKGEYNPKIPLPATPASDAAGRVAAVGEGVEEVSVSDRVVTHFVSDWMDGPFEARYLRGTLGVPGPGVAAERVVLPARAVLPIPDSMSFESACTLPIACLTAWSILVTEARVTEGQWVLSLGTGGVSIFALQIAKALGAKVAITSSSNEKLERAKALDADETLNYIEVPRWDKEVVEITGGGADVVVETVGAATLSQSLKATKAGGLIGLIGSLGGLSSNINLAPAIMKRLRIVGVLVDSRRSFEAMLAFLATHSVEPVVDRQFRFEDLGDAFRYMEEGRHFGKIVVVS